MSIQERLQMIMKSNNLTAAAFADKVGVQRSSISHVMSGRNKPSLDFIQKTLKCFPSVDGDWLVTGRDVKENERKEEGNAPNNKSSSGRLNNPKQIIDDEEQATYSTSTKSKVIDRIMVFYSDGTFEEMLPKQ
ncbi:MAG: helix-turn-helix transcriptional regulator [Brumimicrobium sp.]